MSKKRKETFLWNWLKGKIRKTNWDKASEYNILDKSMIVEHMYDFKCCTFHFTFKRRKYTHI